LEEAAHWKKSASASMLQTKTQTENNYLLIDQEMTNQQVAVKIPAMIDLAIQQPDSLLLKGLDDMILVFAAFSSTKVCYNKL
jgi:hypothetical protein